jgi:hypothetical protein
MISCRPHCLPGEFSFVFFAAVYIPRQTEAGTKTTVKELYSAITKQENDHPEAPLRVAGDSTGVRAQSPPVLPVHPRLHGSFLSERQGVTVKLTPPGSVLSERQGETVQLTPPGSFLSERHSVTVNQRETSMTGGCFIRERPP